MMLRTATKKDVFEYSQMVKQFRAEYPGKLADITGSFKQVVLDDIRRGACRIIEVDGKIAGYVDLMFVHHIKTGKLAHSYILNLFIKSEYRHQGLARDVRKELIKNKTVLGTVISYRRAKDLAEYFKELGYQSLGIRLDSGDLAQLSKDCKKLIQEIAKKFGYEEDFKKIQIVASNDINE